MARRILIHILALLLGGTLGVAVAGLLHREMQVDRMVVVLVVALFIFFSQVIASFMAERGERHREPVFREPVIRGTEPWGWLKPANGIGAGFPLNKECTRLGRGVEMDITLNNASISRRHAQIRRLVEGGLLEDLGSRNGVFVNGVRVKEHTMTDGDQVAIGEVKFVFVRVQSARAAAAAAAAAAFEAVARDDAGRASRPPAERAESRAASSSGIDTDELEAAQKGSEATELPPARAAAAAVSSVPPAEVSGGGGATVIDAPTMPSRPASGERAPRPFDETTDAWRDSGAHGPDA